MKRFGAAPLLIAAALAAGAAPAAAAGRQVTLPSLDGTSLTGQFYEPSTRSHPGVVLVHMLGRSRADWEPPARQLEGAGLAVLAIDLRGHGGSGGRPAPLPDLVQDVRAAVQWLASRPGVRPEAIGVAGASLGANLALLVAAEVAQVRAVAAISPSLDYRGVRVGLEVMRKLGSRPVLLAASTGDPLAARTVRELTSDGAGAREQQFSPVATHGTNLLAADQALAAALVDWLRQRLLS